ncbi:DUF166 family protein [Geoglobus acetivorans]|uniref:DUF166 domain-containing protein n=1 Tax=Geoglobus acetivorans TaxID=565033 RepID=A0ABZ3H222_GEOAI|nr:hypothetical protein [Geoglobus acetivorans]
MRVAILLRKKYGKRAVEQISKKFDVVTFRLPDELPELIDEPEEIELPDEIFESDIILSYALHPDVSYELIRRAEGKNVKAVILPGGPKSGSRTQLKELGEKHGVKVIWEDVCCAAPFIDEEGIAEFFAEFGLPEFEVDVEDGKVKDVRVKRSAICGSSYFVAEKIRGLDIEEAPAKAGYFTQIYPCFASRGIDGKIHRAAHIHKRQVERAIERAKEKCQE